MLLLLGNMFKTLHNICWGGGQENVYQFFFEMKRQRKTIIISGEDVPFKTIQ
jgi:hypothetical protein